MFLNPMVYLGAALAFFAGYRRIHRERRQFGLKISGILAEMNGTGAVSLFGGIALTIVMIGAGFVFSPQTILAINLAVILLSILTRFTLLSAAYTIGLASAVLYLIPLFVSSGSIREAAADVNFSGLAILIGLLLFVEAVIMRRVRQDETLPELVLGKRGKWIGQHHLKKLGIIPFFVLIPSGPLVPFAEYWPYVTIGGSTFGLMLVPMLIGFDYKVRTELPMKAKQKMARGMMVLASAVTFVAIGSLFNQLWALVAVCLAFLGKEWLYYRSRTHEQSMSPFFHETARGLEVLAVLPHSPADRIGIQVGELIRAVNGRKIANADELYQALQTNGSFCKLEVIGHDGEMRIEQSALYEGDHYNLGLIIVDEPYRGDSRLQDDSEHGQSPA